MIAISSKYCVNLAADILSESIELSIKLGIPFASMIEFGVATNVIEGNKTSHFSTLSVFNDKNLRLINVLGRDMEVTPKGAMIFLCNDDVPGVVGNIGTFLGRININIAAYLLNRDKNQNEAFAVIRLDKPLNTNELNRLIKMKGIKWAYQVLV